MERNSINYISLEYFKGIFLAIISFVYMFFYTIFYPVKNQSYPNINQGSGNSDYYGSRRGGGGGGSYRFIRRRGWR